MLLAGRAAAALLLVAIVGVGLVAAWTLGRPLLEGRTGPDIAADPREALVELTFTTAGGRALQAGVSLGNGQIVIPVTWREGAAFDKIEANWGKHVHAEAEIVRVDTERGLALLRTRGALPPAVGPSAALARGDQVVLVGRDGESFLPPAQGTPDVTYVLSVREGKGEVAATGVAVPDLRSPTPSSGPQAGPYLEVRGETWQGLSGGLVLDPQGRPAGLVTLATVLSYGAPGTVYALPLEDVRRWAGLQSTPFSTATPGPPSVVTEPGLNVIYRQDIDGVGQATLKPGQTAAVPLPENYRVCCYSVELMLPEGFDGKARRVIVGPDPSLLVGSSDYPKGFDWGTAYYFSFAAPGQRLEGQTIAGTPAPGVVTIDIQGVRKPDGSPVELEVHAAVRPRGGDAGVADADRAAYAWPRPAPALSLMCVRLPY